MKCPNPDCNATDHEPGAKYCHKCGYLLVNDNSSYIERPKQENRYNLSSAPVGVEAVDLGLPSGTKWASCNVGATKPEEYGGYYAWGETEEKEKIDWKTYIHCDGSSEPCHNLGSDISGTEYDVAHVKWGGNWCMPTWDDIKELLDNCTKEWTTHNGVKGYKLTNKINGNSIFLPAAGYRWDGGLYFACSEGEYWSSTRSPSDADADCACHLFFYSGSVTWNYYACYYGFTVRPVSKN